MVKIIQNGKDEKDRLENILMKELRTFIGKQPKNTNISIKPKNGYGFMDMEFDYLAIYKKTGFFSLPQRMAEMSDPRNSSSFWIYVYDKEFMSYAKKIAENYENMTKGKEAKITTYF